MSVAAVSPRPETSLDLIPERVKRVRAAFDEGRTRPAAWRREQLQALKRMLAENGEALVEALHADLGRPAVEAWTADVGAVKLEADLALKHLDRWMRPEKVRLGMNVRPARGRIVREPLGVVLVIAPWNYPVQLLLSPLVGALAAGNAVVLKPSEVTPHTSAALARLVPQYLDPDAVALVEGGVDETTALLAERFDHIFYTGNGQVARVVMEAAAKHLTPVTLELGGKSPCIVDTDVDLDVTARRIAWGKFLNAGQTCVAPDYILVHESQEEPLIEALATTIRSFYGDDPRQSRSYGRIVNERHHARIARLLENERVVVGGVTDVADRYIAPTIVRDVSPDSPLMSEEIFGPVLPVLPVRDLDHAIDFVNAREKPLALYVFTRNRENEERVVTGTTSGGACVNATIWHLASAELPFGGVGPSGMGDYHGRASFETFSHRKSVLTKGWRPDLKLMYPPYTGLKTRLVKKFLA